MTEVISVKFKNRGKVYFFDPHGIAVRTGEKVDLLDAQVILRGAALTGAHRHEG